MYWSSVQTTDQSEVSSKQTAEHMFQNNFVQSLQTCIMWKVITPLHGWEWKMLVLLKDKKISSRGLLSWRNSMFVSCVFKRRWQLGGRKCRKMPESDICVCRKAKVVELHIVCMLKRSLKKKKKKKFLILKVWFYENSVKLRQSPTHATATVRTPTNKSLWLTSCQSLAAQLD